VLRCIEFRPDPEANAQTLTDDVELFSIDSTDESNVALFHPHTSACAFLGFLYATKDGRIRAFRFERDQTDASAETSRSALRMAVGQR